MNRVPSPKEAMSIATTADLVPRPGLETLRMVANMLNRKRSTDTSVRIRPIENVTAPGAEKWAGRGQ